MRMIKKNIAINVFLSSSCSLQETKSTFGLGGSSAALLVLLDGTSAFVVA